MTRVQPKYKPGDRVMLAEFDNGEEIIPAQKATVLCSEDTTYEIMYTVEIDQPESVHDDRLRELSEDQIAGLLDEEARPCS